MYICQTQTNITKDIIKKNISNINQNILRLNRET